MHNYKLTIAYDGTQYAGWQRQTSRKSHDPRLGVGAPSHQFRTIQETIEIALQKIFHSKIHLIGCGRTDSGVHAICFIANFKTARHIPAKSLKSALNGSLPADIVILKAEECPFGFHSRFNANLKTYRYLIVNSESRTIFGQRYVYWVRFPLGVVLMKQEARCLLGKHDFKSFQASDRVERNSVTIIRKIVIKKQKGSPLFPFLKGQDIISIDITGDGFLRNMVRNIAGTLIEIGRGKIVKGELKRILLAVDRRKAGPCAPACGLYLMKVKYKGA